MNNKGAAGELFDLSSTIVGSISSQCDSKIEVNESFKFEWALKDFQLKIGEYYESPAMTTFENFDRKKPVTWYMKVFPSGDKNNKDHVTAYLECGSCTPESPIECAFDINIRKNSDLLTSYTSSYSPFFSRKFGEIKVWGYPKLIKIGDLNFDPCKDKIFLICSIKKTVTGPVASNRGNRRLFNNELFSDVTIITGDIKIVAHRNILAAHSEVFLEILADDDTCTFKKNKESKQIEITDIPSHAVEQMIKYIYCEDVKDISLDLLIAADKYKINSLKQFCEIILCKSLTLHNAVQVLTVADSYQAEVLKAHAMDFILTNLETMFKPPLLEDVLSLSKILLGELLSKVPGTKHKLQ